MSRRATPIVLSESERRTLTTWIRSTSTEQRLAQRAGIVLAAAEGGVEHADRPAIAGAAFDGEQVAPSLCEAGPGRAAGCRPIRCASTLRRNYRTTHSAATGRAPASWLRRLERPVGGPGTGRRLVPCRLARAAAARHPLAATAVLVREHGPSVCA